MAVQQSPVDVNRLYEIDEAASFLGVSRSTVYALIQEGRLDSVHVARAHRVCGAAIAILARGGDVPAVSAGRISRGIWIHGGGRRVGEMGPPGSGQTHALSGTMVPPIDAGRS
jgi:excisionase family DNA binding protein